MIVQNTRPMSFQSPQARDICMPNMVKMNITMKIRNPFVRTNGVSGFSRWADGVSE